jgi:dTDP-4-amino-4,6-dideoxygalactose transaminase/glycosyltransferase involved in cell wall biosynthesis
VPILTLNSRAVLERVLPKLSALFDDVFLVDGNSTDGTQAYAASLGVRVERQFDTDLPNQRIDDFRAIRLKSWNLCKHDWVFVLDADECPTDEMLDVVRSAVEKNETNEIHAFRRHLQLPSGVIIRGSPFYSAHFVRLFARSSGITLANRKVHERFVWPVERRLINHEEAILCPEPSPDRIAERSRHYAALEAESLHNRSFRYLWRFIFWYNLRSFIGQCLRLGSHWIRARRTGEAALPWSYARVFLLYRWWSFRERVRAWLALRRKPPAAPTDAAASVPVPLIDLRRDVQSHRAEYIEAACRVIDSGAYSLGPEVEAFEKEFASYLGTKHAVGVNGGTEALYASFLALGIGPGDEVIMPANSFIATAEAAVMAGARPVFCDIDPGTHLLDLEACRKLINARTKVIVPVHLYGLVCDMDAVTEFAASHGLKIVEDACQAHGAIRNGRRAGSFGATGCFSFYPTKNLGALGEGGAVATDDDVLAERLRAIRLHGIIKEKYRHDIFGTNLKMEALQAAFLRLRLPRLDAANARRRQIAALYRRGFAGLPVVFPDDSGERHAYHCFILETDARDALKDFLTDRGIGCGIHYPIPMHLQPSMAAYISSDIACPNAERMSGCILSLPVFPELKDEEVEAVIRAVGSFFHSRPS